MRTVELSALKSGLTNNLLEILGMHVCLVTRNCLFLFPVLG